MPCHGDGCDEFSDAAVEARRVRQVAFADIIEMIIRRRAWRCVEHGEDIQSEAVFADEVLWR